MQGPYIEEHPLVPRLREAIGCPVCWEEYIDTDDQLCKDLRLYWVEVAEQFQSYHEMRYYSRIEVDMNFDEAELRRIEMCAKGSLELSGEDITDFPSLARKLRRSPAERATAPPTPLPNLHNLTNFLRQCLSGDTLQALDAYDPATPPPDPLRAHLVQDLNRIVQTITLYSEKRFATVGLRTETNMLLTRNLNQAALLRLNLLLLEDAFPEIAQTHARGWRHRAEDAYRERVGFITEIHFATRAEYDKHYPPPGLTPGQVLANTRGADSRSLFHPQESYDYLQYLLRSAIAVDLRNIADNHPPQLFIEADHEIGACEGQWTRILRLDVDYDTPIAHGHPRSKVPLGEKLLQTLAEKNQYADDEFLTFSNDIDEPRDPDSYARKDWLAKKKKAQ